MKIHRFLEHLPTPRANPPPPLPRSLLAESTSVTLKEPSWLGHDRRSSDNRRVVERREQKGEAFLDTRKIQGRRRTPGRRAQDQQDRAQFVSISIKV